MSFVSNIFVLTIFLNLFLAYTIIICWAPSEDYYNSNHIRYIHS